MHVDYLIIGQGIAGTMLAYELLQAERQVLVVDNPAAPPATRVALGICNPVQGRQVHLAWRVAETFGYAATAYTALSHELQTPIYRPLPFLRLFVDAKQRDKWQHRRHEPGYAAYLGETFDEAGAPPALQAPWGGGEVFGAAWVDGAHLVQRFAAWLQRHNAFHAGRVELTAGPRQPVVQIDGETVHAERIIFCDGHHGAGNSHFAWLPFRLVKGEMLVIRAPELGVDAIVKKEAFLVPLGDHTYWVGSTYDHYDRSLATTAAGRAALVARLDKLLRVPYDILDQQAAIRPKSADGQPLLGLHPQQPWVGIFNGLGSKGFTLAPYWAAHLVAHLELGAPLDPEVDVARFAR